MRPWSAALPALLVLLGGCAGPGASGDPAAGAEGKADDDAMDAMALAPLLLESSVPLSGVVVVDDAFPVADTCNANPARGCVERPHDLGSQLPAGVPMKVTLDLTWQPGDGIFHMEAWVDGEGMTWLRVDEPTLEPGHWQWTAVVVPGAESTAYVISGGPQSAADPGDSPYHLEINFTASNQTVPEFVPLAVALGPNGTLRAESPDGGAARFLLYGPDDLLLEDVNGEVTLPLDAARGDYIAMPQELATFLVPGGGELRYVGTTFTVSDEVAVAAGGSAEARVSSVTPPFLAGAYYYGQRDTPIMFSAELRVTLTDPDGTTLLTEPGCQPFCLGGFSGSWSTGFGDALKEGQYTVTVESAGAHDTYVGAYLIGFDRSTL